jgi:hypothetical protein
VSGTSKGLGLLPVDSTICSTDEKVVTPRTALLDQSEEVHGFERHCGQMIRAFGTEPLIQILDTNEAEGARMGKVSGCYLHGIEKQTRETVTAAPSRSRECFFTRGAYLYTRPLRPTYRSLGDMRLHCGNHNGHGIRLKIDQIVSCCQDMNEQTVHNSQV